MEYVNLAVLLTSVLISISAVSGHSMYTARVDVLGGTVVLNCTDAETPDPGDSVTHWMEPGKFQILLPGESARGMEVSADGYSLTIPTVTANHLGNYFCLITTVAADAEYTRTTLFLYEPVFMDVYKSNLIIGLSAAGTFLVVSTIGCCVYVLKFEAHPDDDGEPYDTYENGGYVTASAQDLGVKKSYQLDTQF